MNKSKLITSFDQFEKIYESVENGTPVKADDINEGIFSGIMNFFSKVFGGRITDLDVLLRKYKDNETKYWGKWAHANHEYNKAAAQREVATDPIDKRKHLEMMERASNLIKQTTVSRHAINDALDRQAQIMIRGNQRLRSYWEMKRAKADEYVADKSYTTLKKEVDADTVDELYDRVKETQEKAKTKIAKMPKGTSTIEFGDYADKSEETQEVPMSKFGVHDLDDFVYSSDDLWNDRVKLMPKANLLIIADQLRDTINRITDETNEEVKKYKKQLETAEGGKKERLEKDLKHIESYTAEDIQKLEDRLTQVVGEKPTKDDEPKTTVVTPVQKTGFAIRIEEAIDKIKRKVGDVSEKELNLVMDDMLALYDKMPDEDKDETKEENIRMVQLIDFSSDIYTFRQSNKIVGPTTGVNLDNLYKEFKKEFPR